MRSQVTLKDIAKMLGVSVPTVSRALKDYPDISKETKQKVLNLVKELNYTPNQFALSLRKNKSFTIGVLIPEIVHHFFSTVISGIMEVADEKGYSVMLFQSNESLERESREAKVMLNGRVDGLLISLSNETQNLDHLSDFEKNDVPIIYFDKVLAEVKGSKVVVDDFKGGYDATRHLIDQGNTNIAYIRGPLKPLNSIQRFNGFRQALQDAGLPYNADFIRVCKKVSQEEGYEFTIDLLNQKTLPDGIFAATDNVAIGVMQAIKEKGLKIPDDIAVVGFSDWRMAAAVEPPLTSVRQPGFDMGVLAAQTLFDQIDKIENGKTVIHMTQTLDTELIIRKSSVKTLDSIQQTSKEVT